MGSEVVAIEKSQYPSNPNEQPKRLRVCKFQEDELEWMCGKNIKRERQEWGLILHQKEQKDPTYFEKVSKPMTNNDLHKTAIMKKEMKMRLFTIHQRIMEALEEARRQKGMLTREEQQLLDDLIKQPFDPEHFVDKQFK